MNEQARLHLQLGQSIVAVHNQQQTGLQEIRQRLKTLEQAYRRQQPEPSDIHSPPPDQRPALFTPAPAIPKFQNKNTQQPVRFLERLEQYFKKMQTPPQNQLDIVTEALEEEARDWATIFKVTWSSFADFRQDFLQSFWSEQDQIQLRQKITTQRWQPGQRPMEAHFAHYLGQARLLTTHPIPDNLLVAELIKHFPTNVQSLWSLHPEKTVAAAAEFLRQQDVILASSNPKQQTTYSSSEPKRFRLDRRFSAVPPLILNRASGNAPRSDR